jgi:phosphodiester glycosidase
MPRRSVPVARLSAFVAVVAAVWVVARASHIPRWRAVAHGLEFTMLRGEPFCRHGSAAIAVLRVDPARVRVRVLHFSPHPADEPPTIVEWQRQTGALAVFNAGQFYPDWSYMGLLVTGGAAVSSTPHPGFRAALVAAPGPGHPNARVLDLDAEPLPRDSLPWSEVAQSFMLFDRRGTVRVRHSDLVANRTAVAEDRAGHLLVFTSEGGYTLFDFARLLRDSPLSLTHAMAMDGGYEAEMLVKSPAVRYASFGRWERDDQGVDTPGALTPLPTVVALSAP